MISFLSLNPTGSESFKSKHLDPRLLIITKTSFLISASMGVSGQVVKAMAKNLVKHPSRNLRPAGLFSTTTNDSTREKSTHNKR